MEDNFERIEAFQQGQFSTEEQAHFEQELTTNENLREELALYRLSHQAVEEGIGNSLREDMEQWDQEEEKKAPIPISSARRRWWLAAAAILLLLGAFWFLQNRNNALSAPALADSYFPEKIKVENVRGTAIDTSLKTSLTLIDQGVNALANQQDAAANDYFENAAETLSEITKTNPAYPLAQLQSGILWYRLQAYPNAIAAFNRVVAHPNAKYQEEARWYRLLAHLAHRGADLNFQSDLEQMIQDPDFSMQKKAVELKAKSKHLIKVLK